MPSLQSLKLGDSSFMYCDRVVFESRFFSLDLPELTSIQLGDDALTFFPYRETIESIAGRNETTLESNTLIMRSGEMGVN